MSKHHSSSKLEKLPGNQLMEYIKFRTLKKREISSGTRQRMGNYLLPYELTEGIERLRKLDKPATKSQKFIGWTLINHNGTFYIIFNFIYSLAAVLSSYFYFFFAAFKINPVYVVWSEELQKGVLTIDTSICDAHFIRLLILMEFYFLLRIVILFRLTFTDAKSSKKITSGSKIACRYVKSNFVVDLISTVPFTLIKLNRNLDCLLFLLKVSRIVFSKVDVTKLIDHLRSLNLQIQTVSQCDCREEDHNKIGLFYGFSNFLKLLKMMFNILSFTFSLAMLFKIMTNLVEDYYHWSGKPEELYESNHTFFVYYGL